VNFIDRDAQQLVRRCLLTPQCKIECHGHLERPIQFLRDTDDAEGQRQFSTEEVMEHGVLGASRFVADRILNLHVLHGRDEGQRRLLHPR